MNLGQKIKNLRTEKMMTQKELAGNEITRNMLSQIENGSALPSLSTVIYLAGKLGVSAGYLLSEGDEEFIYYKSRTMKNIKRAYTDRRFELCREMCLSSFDEYDDELELILTDSCLGLAQECVMNGKLYRACRLLDEAWLHANKTVYPTSSQRHRILVIFSFLKELSPTLDSYEADTDSIEHLMTPLLYDDVFCKYISVFFNLGDYMSTDEIFDTRCENSNEYDGLLVAHLKAKMLIDAGNYSTASKILLEIIDGEITTPRLLLYLTCCDMELCCKEMGDYKGAYEFSNNRLEIYEHMLIDD